MFTIIYYIILVYLIKLMVLMNYLFFYKICMKPTILNVYDIYD